MTGDIRTVIGSPMALAIGDRREGVTDGHGSPHKRQAFVVTGEATLSDYVGFCESQGVRVNLLALARVENPKFYFVQMD